MQEKRSLVRSVIEELGISRHINNVVIEGTDSPWLEKALIKRKKGTLDVKTYIWMDEAFVYGRIYRLFLYVADVLDGAFLYDPRITPDEEKESSIRDRYNQIWSLYVDSRMERLGIESFFDRALRRNLFIDLESRLGWAEAGKIFDSLWSRELFTYPEIVDLSYHLEERFPGQPASPGSPCIERDLADCLHDPSVAGHIERLDSPGAATVLNDLLSFTAYSCRDGLIAPCHYGIVFLFQNKVLLEFIPSGGHAFVLSILDPRSGMYDTREIGEDADVEVIQKTIKDRYAMLAVSARGQFG
ncbi:MAG: hypothetical protein A4E60_03064 [Syntrophorhabdus sp. PtaB.Bin047]|nr:MAG: hypothetical protein A4E60_03064 [Syntrophorhabdus sp. PtaB.Bin047]